MNKKTDDMVLKMLKAYRKASDKNYIMELTKDNFKDFCYNDYTTWENFSDECKKLNIDMSKISLLPDAGFMQNVFYHPTDGVYENIMLDYKYLSMFQVPKRVEVITEKVKENFEKHDWDLYFSFIPDPFKIIEFENVYAKLKEDSKNNSGEIFECFKAVYVSLDYSNGLWDKDIVRGIIEEQKAKNRQLEETNDNIIEIYRGAGTESTDITEAISWTTSKEVARSFADKGDNGIIYTAEIEEKNTVPIKETGEDEVLVLYEDLLNIEKEAI